MQPSDGLPTKPKRSRSLSPGEALAAWRVRNGLTQTACATLIHTRAASWCEWEGGSRSPGLTWAFAIEILTNGEVPARIWAKQSLGKIKPFRRPEAAKQAQEAEAAA